MITLVIVIGSVLGMLIMLGALIADDYRRERDTDVVPLDDLLGGRR